VEIDEQVRRILNLVIERKLKLNNVNQTRCLDNEEDEDDRKCKDELREQVYKLAIECCFME